MNYLKRYGFKGCLFLAWEKVSKLKKIKAASYTERLPELSWEPFVSVVLYGDGDEEKSLKSVKNQVYGRVEVSDYAGAKGDYIAFLQRGDVLEANAVYFMLEEMLRSGADCVYCDEVGWYKPDFSPDTLLSCNYIGFFIIKRELAQKTERPTDMLKADNLRVAHCARALSQSDRKISFENEEIRSVEGKVSIIIPSKDNYEVLKACVDSIRAKTVGTEYEIIVVDNGSCDEVRQKYAELADKYIYEVCDFNFSYMCNRGARAAEGRFLLFLNDDTEVTDGAWLKKMAYYAAKPKSGAIGAKLYYPNSRRIQHCGVINIQPGPAHALLGEDDTELLYNGRNRGVWNYTAVTAACLMVEGKKFDGFDEAFGVAYNDVELCMRLIASGYRNMVVNDVVLYHYESISRGDDRLSQEKLKRLGLERERLFDKHPDFAGRDDFYNINLSPYRVDFAPRYPSEHKYVPISKLPAEGAFTCKIEYAISGDRVRISGYGFKSGYERIYLLLKGEDKTYRVSVKREMRTDLEAIYGREALLSGFAVVSEATVLPKGHYKVGIMLTDLSGVKKLATLTTQEVEFL